MGPWGTCMLGGLELEMYTARLLSMNYGLLQGKDGPFFWAIFKELWPTSG